MELYKILCVGVDDLENEISSRGWFDDEFCYIDVPIKLKPIKPNEHELIIYYKDVERVIKALRQGKRQIDRYHRNKAKKGAAKHE